MIDKLQRIITLLLIVQVICLPVVAVATNAETSYFASIGQNMAAFSGNNEFLFQCIVALLLIMIFSYAAKLLYERKINKE